MKKQLRACWQEIHIFLFENEAPAGMLAGNPDLLSGIQTFLGGKYSLGATLTDVYFAVGTKS